MLYLNNRFSALNKLMTLGLILWLTMVGAALAQRVTHDRQTTDDVPLSQPLAPTDPRAQLRPELQNVPPIPFPFYAAPGLSPQAAAGERTVETEEYNVATATATAVARSRIFQTEAFNAPQHWPGSIGPEASLDARENNRLRIESVIGADNRERITNTTAFPWRTMTKLYMTFPNGSRYMGSGILIGAKYVLTAGHVVYSASDGGWARTIEVIPGLSGNYMPYGSASATYVRSYTGWTRYSDSDYDIALITLNRSIGNSTGWLGYAYYPSVNGITAHLAGYPGDRDNGRRLYYHYGSILGSTTNRVRYTIDTAGGQSGSGVYRLNSGQRYVFAVHTNGGTTSNSGTRITRQRFDDIRNWIASGN